MYRMGIPRPPFALENQMYKRLKRIVLETAKKVLRDFAAEARMNNLYFKDGQLVNDGSETLKDLMDFFDEMGRQEEARSKFINEMKMSSIGASLKERWLQEADMNDEIDDEEENALVEALETFFKKDQEKMLETLKKDASEKHNVRVTFSLDKQKIFDENMAGLRKRYIDNSIKRIRGEQNDIKKAFLRRLVDYATGKTETLEIGDVMRQIVEIGDGMARMFARD